MVDKEVACFLSERMRSHPWWPRFEQMVQGWDVGFARMDGDEFIDWHRRILRVALWLPDPMFRMAHAIGHVVKHRCAEGRTFTGSEEVEADEFAAFYRIVANADLDEETLDREEVA